MLEPEDRTSLVDVLRPPRGYRLEAALGSTYSLDLDVLAAALLAFADVEMAEDPSPADRAAVVQAVTRLARCVRVFVNRGSIRHSAGARPNRLFGFFDRVVRDVTLVDASLHAKVWVLKYVPQGRPELSDSGPVYRFLCASRNLSTSRAWELGLRLDGTAGGEGSDLGRSLGDFCRTVLRQDARPPAALVALSREIETIRFVTSREMESRLEFLWQWPGRPGLYRHLPAKGRRALLVSPFVRARFLELLLGRFEEVTIISTQQELDALSDATQERLARARVLVLSGHDAAEGTTTLGLHAKLLLCESGATSRTYLGSANASERAWGLKLERNCEALVAFEPGIGIDRFVRAFIQGPKGRHPWIDEYRRGPRQADDPIEAATQELDRLITRAACLDIHARYDPEKCELMLEATTPPTEPLEVPSYVSLDVAPLLLTERQDAFRRLEELRAGGVPYAEVKPADMCDFLVIRALDRRHDITRSVVVRARSSHAPGLEESRDDALRARLLEGLDLGTLLGNVLWGVGRRPPGRVTSEGSRRAGRHGVSWLPAGVTIEAILEACTEDPGRIEEIDALLRAFSAQAPVDGTLVEFWERFKAAHGAVLQEKADA